MWPGWRQGHTISLVMTGAGQAGGGAGVVVAQGQTGGVAWLEMGVSLGDGTWQGQSLLW